jgi:peptide/nickel transport system ATP-binding protein
MLDTQYGEIVDSLPINPKLVTVEGLSVSYQVGRKTAQVLHEVSMAVASREVVAIVGESGSGKSTLANAIAAMLPENSTVAHGKLLFSDIEIGRLREAQARKIRGKRIGVIPQDPMSSLNPTQKIGVQVAEPLLLHKLASKHTARARVLELLRDAGLFEPEKIINSYPHELSGGMKQRVLIAIAFAAEPELIIADEPTSALDVTVAKRVMDHLGRLVQETHTALILITHDLALAVHRAHRVVVMQAGQIVEVGTASEVIHSPKHPYTQLLVANAPHLLATRAQGTEARTGSIAILDRPVVEARPQVVISDFDPSNSDAILQVKNLVKVYPGRGKGAEENLAVNDVSFAIPRGKTLAIVGESGSGKSTTARMVLRLEKPTAGSIEFMGKDITNARGDELREVRRSMQVIYQSPFASLDPRMKLVDIVEEPLRAFKIGTKRERQAKVTELFDAVGLPASYLSRKPVELSGGQRQRVAIARSLALSPELVICDEPVSALDVLVQAQVLGLLRRLQVEYNVAYLFISHDLAIVNHFADYVGIMSRGHMVESGITQEVFSNPREQYTKTLLDSAFNL